MTSGSGNGGFADVYVVPKQDGRCESVLRHWRCQRPDGHEGVHQADVGRSPAVLRWGMGVWGCDDPDCIREPGHERPHRDGTGMAWWPAKSDVLDPLVFGSADEVELLARGEMRAGE